MNLFAELSLVLIVATIVAAAMQRIKQPLIIGHIVTGILVGPYVFNVIQSAEIFELLSKLGVTLLLFIIGLSLNPKVLKEVGTPALVIGIGQIAGTALVGGTIAFAFGLSLMSSLFIGVALSLSSTIVILKLLSDMRQLGTLHGKITIGILVLQDIVASAALVVVGSAHGGHSQAQLGLLGSKVFLFVGGIWLLVRFIVPKIAPLIAASQEFLFLFTLGWGLGIASLASMVGFSPEIGALVAGVALASTPYAHEIAAKMRPLRDFFVVVFFIILGAQFGINDVHTVIVPALFLSLFVLLGKPFITTLLAALSHYRSETSIKTGLMLGQVSEFSFILVLLGAQLGMIPQPIVSLVTLTAIITLTFSSYFILYSDKLYRFLRPYITKAEHNDHSQPKLKHEYDIFVFGYKKAGRHFVDELIRLEQRFLVIDFDPQMIKNLEDRGIPCLFGDASNPELLGDLDLATAQVVVCNIAHYVTSNLLLSIVHTANPNTVVVLTCDDPREAAELYHAGATYVVMPHYLGGTKISSIIDRYGLSREVFEREQQKHLSYLFKIHGIS